MPQRVSAPPRSSAALSSVNRPSLMSFSKYGLRYWSILPTSRGDYSGLLWGNLGISFIDQRPVAGEIMDRLPNTLLLTVTAFAISLCIAVPLGVLSAIKQHSWLDSVGTVLSTAGVSIPSFWFGLIAILLFSVKLRWLPTGGMYTLGKEKDLFDLLKHLIMPASILSILNIAGWNRFVRASVLGDNQPTT